MAQRHHPSRSLSGRLCPSIVDVTCACARAVWPARCLLAASSSLAASLTLSCLVAWLPGFLAAWLPGCLAAWPPEAASAWLTGRLNDWPD